MTCRWKDLIKWVLAPLASPDDEFNLPPDALMEEYLRRSAYEFAFETGVLRHTFKQDLQCGVCDYPANLGNCHEVLDVKNVWVDLCPNSDSKYFESFENERRTKYYPRSLSRFHRSTTRHLDKDAYHLQNDMLFLRDIPNKDVRHGLVIEISYAPLLDSTCDVPEEFCTRYRDAIVSGAVSYLFGMPNMDWSDTNLALLNERRYRKGIALARSRSVNKGTIGNIRDARTGFLT